MLILILMILMLALASANAEKQVIGDYIPVVYVLFGHTPKYLIVNIELASRNNPVVVLTDTPVDAAWKNGLEDKESKYDYDNQKVEFSIMDGNLTASATEFAKHYVHLSKDNSVGRKTHELQNFQRWFILKDYMETHNIPHAFFGDGDTAVFSNMASAYQQRSECDASIITPGVGNNYSWVSTGVATLWSRFAIADFCAFTQDVYRSKTPNFVDSLRIKQRQGSSVVDMSLLWLWWVNTHRNDPIGWATGRPFHSLNPRHTEEDFQQRSDKAFEFAKGLKTPPPSPVRKSQTFKVCNGLDVVHRTVFDHMRGWSDAPNMTLIQVEGEGAEAHTPFPGCPHCPYVQADALLVGGVPESLDRAKLAELRHARLYLHSLHYQGDTKRYLMYDVCRVLLYTSSRRIRMVAVRNMCQEELKSFQDNDKNRDKYKDKDKIGVGGAAALPPCMPHKVYDRSGKGGSPPEVCF